MTIRRRIILIVGLTVLFLLAAVYLAGFIVFRQGFRTVENEQAINNVKRLTQALEQDLSDLSRRVADWSKWDDTYEFVSDKNQDYLDSNLSAFSVANAGVNLMIFLDQRGEIVESRLVDFQTLNLMPLPDSLRAYLKAGSPLLDLPAIDSEVKGIIKLPELALLVAARPIVKSDGAGPARGTLVMALIIDESIIKSLAEVTRVDVRLAPWSDAAFLALNKEAARLTQDQTDFYIQPLDQDRITGFTVVKGLDRRPALLAQVTFPRRVYAQGLRTIFFFTLTYALSGLFFLWLVVWLLQRYILARLSGMDEQISNLAKAGDLETRLEVGGSDELGRLAETINAYLTSLGQTRSQLETQSKELSEKNLTLENTQRAVINVLEDLELEKKRVEETVVLRTRELTEENARLLASINSAPIGFAIIGLDYHIIVHNQLLVKLLNLPAAGLDFGAVAKRLELNFNLPELFQQTTSQRKIIDLPSVVLDDRYLHCLIAPIVIPDVTNQVIGTILLVEDITKEKLLDRTKEEFFAVASHELRTPLTAIRGNMAMIRDFFLPGIKNADLTEMINDSYEGAVRLIGIVNDFLDVGRLEQGKVTFKPEPVDLKALVAEVSHEAETLVLSKKLTLQINLPADLPVALTDRNRTKQIIFNLIGNALNYTRAGGVTIGGEKLDGAVKLTVTDTGLGISTQNQQLLFKKFQQAGESFVTRDATKSTGLGLYISKLLAEGMGGRVALEKSELGNGSTFSVTFPVAPG